MAILPEVGHPNLRWVVEIKVNEVVSGPAIGDYFWFAVHSPPREGVKVGQRYKNVAKKKDDVYDLVSRERQD